MRFGVWYTYSRRLPARFRLRLFGFLVCVTLCTVLTYRFDSLIRLATRLPCQYNPLSSFVIPTYVPSVYYIMYLTPRDLTQYSDSCSTDIVPV
ncbi:hypothetical protein FA13DRAFT_1131704 [Coprinellus micaceus]|uniref:Uncharacterized protein n=1 Tax=Coprinellus micaceus TaxID=71717 RepID=A0A4Y7SVB6_COPMI|nr:hypothetical protein FA13DRAFT_1131704 [Coprinellus micaceus]